MKSIIPIPSHGGVRESMRSYYWMDDSGILFVVSKKVDNPGTVDDVKKLLIGFMAETQGKKFCVLNDSTNSAPYDKETREYLAIEFPKLVKAMAVISASAAGRMIGNLFLAMKKPPYPTKIFNTEKEAKEWLSQYL